MRTGHVSPSAAADPVRGSHANRMSEASTGTTASGGSAGSHAAAERAVTFATGDHGIVSVNLDDLSSALGVRRADVASQRLMFHARSAPARRNERTLLGSAPAVAPPTPPSPTGARWRDLRHITTTPPLPPRLVHYQRRHSTLRGTQLDADATAHAGALRLTPTPPPLSPPLPLSPSLSSAVPPRLGTPPPPVGASALRTAVARGVSGVPGSVPSLLRREAALRRAPASDDERDADLNDGDDAGAPLLSATVSSLADRSGAGAAAGWHRTPSPAPRASDPTPQHGGAAAGEAVPSATPSRRVHFSEDVIESIHVARQEDEYMRLVVVYSRPWYAYALLGLFGLLLGLSYSSVVYLEERQLGLGDRAMSVGLVLFLVLGIGAAALTAHLVLCWRPDGEEEQSFFEDAEQRSRLPQLWLCCAVFLWGSTAAVTFSRFTSGTVAAVMAVALACHLVAERVHRGDGGDRVTRWDVLGSVTTVVGAVLVEGASVWQEAVAARTAAKDALLIVLWWAVSVSVTGVCWTCFTRELRDMSQRVSQQFLLASSLVVGTAALGIAAYILSVLLSPDGAAVALGADAARALRLSVSALLPCRSFFPDAVVLLGGGLCALASWYVYHSVSFYVDHVASAACMLMGAMLSAVPLAVTRVLRIGWADVAASAPLLWSVVVASVGAVVVELGAVWVVWAGLRYRREVEIRVVVE
ncbi:hypothetical protein NESM_000512500 [Novymonas esmeraldas]|uniref:Transmembrane protein n=1 Tax=Novymonas esmeraldas TaxID=1808958 RepID=A0AAW0ER17_9TRYP